MPNNVSILIPAYNGKKFIAETIDSCLRQTHKEIEVIVIDDGSTDGTRELLLSYADKVKLIFNEKNLGIVKNINQGINKVDSEFFVLLGHDDVLPEKHIELMLSEFNDDVVGVHCNSILINSLGERLGYSRDDNIQKRKTENILFELSLDNFISSCGMLQRTSVFRAVKGWDETFLHYGEWLYYVKALTYGEMIYTTKTHAYYRRHDSNITNTFKDKDVIKKLDSYKNKCRNLAHQNNKNSSIEVFRYKLNIIKLALKRYVLNVVNK